MTRSQLMEQLNCLLDLFAEIEWVKSMKPRTITAFEKLGKYTCTHKYRLSTRRQKVVN